MGTMAFRRHVLEVSGCFVGQLKVRRGRRAAAGGVRGVDGRHNRDDDAPLVGRTVADDVVAGARRAQRRLGRSAAAAAAAAARVVRNGGRRGGGRSDGLASRRPGRPGRVVGRQLAAAQHASTEDSTGRRLSPKTN